MRTRVVASIVLGLLLSLALAPLPARAEVTKSTRIADRTTPAVHLVVVSYAGEARVPAVTFNEEAIVELAAQIRRQVESGVTAQNPAAIQQALVDALAKDPLAYFVPGAGSTAIPVELTSIGTAFSITPDGVMITAAHVVQDDERQLVNAVVDKAMGTVLEKEVEALTSDPRVKLTPEQIKQLIPAIQKWFLRYIKVDGIQRKLSVRFAEPTTDGSKVGKLSPARVVAAGEGYPGKDYAILRVDGVTNAPTLPLGNDSEIVGGSSLYVAGYTAASTFFAGASTDSVNQPAVTEGPVSAVKSNDQGVPYFQTQAPAGPGNSGGPVLNDRGEVVGILVARSLDSDGTGLDGQQWVLPLRVAQEAIRSENIQPSMSRTSELFNEALDLFYEERYVEAIPKFEEVRRLFPGHAYAVQFLQRAQTAVSEGKGRQPMHPVLFWGLILGGAVLVAGAITVILVLVKKRKAQPGLGTQAPLAPQAQNWPQGGATMPPHAFTQQHAPAPPVAGNQGGPYPPAPGNPPRQ